MDRRAFLLFRTKGRERVLELSCERLYMRWADASSGAGAVDGVESVPAGQLVGHEPWDGEPPTAVVTQTVQELFTELDGGLAVADTLRMKGVEWLADERFCGEVESRVDAFRARGGRVEAE